ncbi:MAG: FecR domain-containing protein, partial [Magnetovibrio sp.]|nr:FecR domain-containing protein [Magnetovibrio sp.]
MKHLSTETSDKFTLLNSIDVNGRLVLPAGLDFLHADFTHSGPDLTIKTPDGQQFVIPDFFMSDTPPDLATDWGGILSADLVTKLAGPMVSGLFAQSFDNAALSVSFGEPIGLVTELEGSVKVTHADGAQVTLVAGGNIFQGDVLETGATGSIGIAFIDDTTFSLGEDARMVMDEMVYDPDTQEGSFSATVLIGTFSFVSGKIAKTSPDAMTLATPTATIGIRGSTGLGEA